MNSHMNRLTNKSSFSSYAAALEAFEPFTTGGSFHGGPVNPGDSIGRGFLSPEYHHSASAADYVVYSYNTPIAWHLSHDDGEDRWIVPDVKYSMTTTRHQGKISTAISVMS